MELEDEMPMECPMCSAENAPLGVLGQTVHYSCRMCGWEYSEEIDHEEAA